MFFFCFFLEEPHASHLSIEQAIQHVLRFKPRRALFTGFTHQIDYRTLNTRLARHADLIREGIRCRAAFDGMIVSLETTGGSNYSNNIVKSGLQNKL